MREDMATEHVRDAAPVRPRGEALRDIAGLSAITTVLALLFLALPGGDVVERVRDSAPTAGLSVLDHIGWGLGVEIPVMIGFYAIVIGGQLVASPDVASRTRRHLGFLAEAMAGCLTPALLLVIVACIHDPKVAGSLFVIVPTAGVAYFLASQLGGFAVFEDSLVLANARDTRAWAEEKLTFLKHRSRRSAWLVGSANAAVIGISGIVVTVLVAVPEGSVALVALAYLVFAGFLVAVGRYFIHASLSARYRIDVVFVWLASTLLLLLALVLPVVFFSSGVPSAGLALAVMLALALLSTLWPRKIRRTLLGQWSVNRIGVAGAAKEVTSIRARSVRTIVRLSRVDRPELGPPSRIERLLSAVRGSLRGDEVAQRAPR